jgi:hypothetical protein
VEEGLEGQERAGQEVAELQEEQAKLLQLTRTPGWEYFQEILAAQEKTRSDTVLLTPLRSMDQVLEQEYQKGEIAGIMLSAKLVKARLDDIHERLTELLKPKSEEGQES